MTLHLLGLLEGGIALHQGKCKGRIPNIEPKPNWFLVSATISGRCNSNEASKPLFSEGVEVKIAIYIQNTLLRSL